MCSHMFNLIILKKLININDSDKSIFSVTKKLF